jgi:hypothetical protein
MLATVEATAIVGIVVAGVVGPAVAALAMWVADRRRFIHETKLKASDDLVARLDEVAVGLDQLGATCAVMRGAFIGDGIDKPEKVWPTVYPVRDAYQRARGLNARLGMRPHADPSIVEKAEAAAERMHEAEGHVITILVESRAGLPTREDSMRLGPVFDNIEAGQSLKREYEGLARGAIAGLLPTD